MGYNWGMVKYFFGVILLNTFPMYVFGSGILTSWEFLNAFAVKQSVDAAISVATDYYIAKLTVPVGRVPHCTGVRGSCDEHWARGSGRVCCCEREMASGCIGRLEDASLQLSPNRKKRTDSTIT